MTLLLTCHGVFRELFLTLTFNKLLLYCTHRCVQYSKQSCTVRYYKISRQQTVEMNHGMEVSS